MEGNGYRSSFPRYKQKSRCSPVFRLPTTGAAEITSLSAVNEFYSRILSPGVLQMASRQALPPVQRPMSIRALGTARAPGPTDPVN